MVGLILPILLFASPIQDTVTVTTYKANTNETDSTPDITASGFKITNPKKHRIIAVSRDLLKRYPFGTLVRIKGAGSFDGIWRVEDVMAKRWTKKIDLLINYNVKHNKFNNVKIDKYEKISYTPNNNIVYNVPIFKLYSK